MTTPPRNQFPWITRGAAYATVFLFILSVALAATSYFLSVSAVSRSVSAVSRSVRNTATLTQLCESGNEFRVQQIVLWDHVITIAQPPPHETTAERKARLATLRTFEAYIHKVFAPRNCAHPSRTEHR